MREEVWPATHLLKLTSITHVLVRTVFTYCTHPLRFCSIEFEQYIDSNAEADGARRTIDISSLFDRAESK